MFSWRTGNQGTLIVIIAVIFLHFLFQKHFHQTILANKPDLFLDAMVLSLENSVSMRRVIFPNGLPDGRDLHLYPRLIGIRWLLSSLSSEMSRFQ